MAGDETIISETADDLDIDGSSAVITPEADEPEPSPPTALEQARADTAAGSSTDTEAEEAAVTEAQTRIAARDPAGKFKKQSATERRAELQAHINQLTRDKTTARQELEAEHARIARLRAEAQSLTRPAAPEQPKAPSGTPTWKQFEDAGKSWEEYEEAKDAWVTAAAKREALAEFDDRQRFASRNHAERQAAAAYDRKMDAARAAHPDFDAVITQGGDLDVPTLAFMRFAMERSDKGGEMLYALAQPQHRQHAETLNELIASIPHVEQTYAMMDALLLSSDPVKLVLAYAEHADEIQAIARLPRTPALAALVKFDVRYVEGAKNGSPSVPKPQPSAAPPPSHRAGSRPASAPRNTVDLPPDDYVRERTEQERQKRAARFA